MIKPWPHQEELAALGLIILKQYFILYLAMEERTGKTLCAILICEQLPNINNILVITKKKAVDGWNKTLAEYPHNKVYTVINYHGAAKIAKLYDLVILDEAHSYISGYPKISQIWAAIKKLARLKPIIYLSATPHAQGPQLLYHQFALSSWSPWRAFGSFYEWYAEYAKRDSKGQTDKKWISGRMIETYAKMQDDVVLGMVKHLFVTKTRKELGFEHEPEDEKHYLELGEQTKLAYNLLLKHKVLEFLIGEKEYKLIADTPSKLRFALHMLEGGTLKVGDDYVVLNSSEKIDYIKAKWGDNSNVVIMHNYIAEAEKLSKAFKHARILQATSFAEGVDLSMYEHLIIYSQDFSTARHTQRRARQANMERKTEIKVHFLLVRKAASEQAYKTVVVNKTNFVDSLFEKEEL